MDIRAEIREIALKFMESPEMVEFMRKKDNLSVLGSIYMIMGSRAPLEDKVSAIRLVSDKLKESENASENWTQQYIQLRITECDTIIKIVEFAFNEMVDNNPAGTIFILTEHSVVNNIDVNPAVFPFTTFEAAKCGLIKKADVWWGKESDDRQYNWYHINKWIPASNGEMQHIVEWKLSHEGVILEAHGHYVLDDISLDSYVTYCDYLEGFTSLCVPYKSGDIITVDCRPARKISHAVIAENNNKLNYDGKRLIYLTSDGELKSSDIRGHLTEYNMFSGSYRLEKFTGELPDCEAVLKKISEEIKRNPAIGREDNVDEYLKECRDNIKNFMPVGTIVGDIIKISSSGCDCGGYGRDFDAVITDITGSEDDVEVFELYMAGRRREWEIKWRRISLKNKLENKHEFIIERYTVDMIKNVLEEFSDDVFERLIKISEELKRNPALANDDKFIEKLIYEKNN